MSISVKADMAVRLPHDCLAMAAAGIRQRHPTADDHEMRMRLGVLRVGPELMLKTFGWDVAEHGYDPMVNPLELARAIGERRRVAAWCTAHPGTL